MAYSPVPPQAGLSAIEQHSSSPQPLAPSCANESLSDGFNRRLDLPRQPGPPPKGGIILVALIFIWKNLVLPAVGLAYLTFCYVCHFRTVRIGSISDPAAHLSLIKAGVTSISILIVSISLLPLYSLISELKSEEFFRLLFARRQGVPLKSINNISTPSYGIRDSLVTSYHRHASIYFTGALLATLLALATSALAPAVLSVGTVLFDGELVALSVGAIQRNSILNMSDFTAVLKIGDVTSLGVLKGRQAGDVAWAESSLGVNYSFQSPSVDQTTYIVPSPPKLPAQKRARWISDIIAMRPACEWIAPDIESSGGLNLSDLGPDSFDVTVKMKLPSKEAQVAVPARILDHAPPSLELLTSSWAESSLSLDSLAGPMIVDLSTMDDITNGAAVFYFIQCASGCYSDAPPVNLNISPELHTARFTSTDGQAFDLSFLYCDPKAEIQTRKISHDGRGALLVGDKTSTPQGNLHPARTIPLLSYALMALGEAGPETPMRWSFLGKEVQLSMIFGNLSLDPEQIPVKPLDQITASYASILQSAMKPFLDGTVASTHVPARATQEIAVLVSSRPHFIASTVLYVLLMLFSLVCHFRRQAAQFTFFAIASRLANSNIPPLFAGLRGTEKGGSPAEDTAVSSLKKARVFLEEGEVLNLRNDI